MQQKELGISWNDGEPWPTDCHGRKPKAMVRDCGNGPDNQNGVGNITGGIVMKYIVLSNLGLIVTLLALFGKSVWGKSVW